MKKKILILLFLVISQFAFADTISTNKSDFQKVSDVIYDLKRNLRE